MEIYPAILSDEPTIIAEQLAAAVASAEISVIQFDIIDSYFADNVTVSPADLGQFSFGDKQIDLHFMTNEPLDALYETRDYEELPIRGVIAQVEKMSSQESFIKEAKNEEWLPGLSLDLFTPLSAIEANSWNNIKILQIMGIEAGFQGQTFSFSALAKLKKAAEYIAANDLAIELIVDGGVKLDTIVAIAEAGADSVSIGSGLWQAQDFDTVLEHYQQKVTERLHD